MAPGYLSGKNPSTKTRKWFHKVLEDLLKGVVEFPLILKELSSRSFSQTNTRGPTEAFVICSESLFNGSRALGLQRSADIQHVCPGLALRLPCYYTCILSRLISMWRS